MMTSDELTRRRRQMQRRIRVVLAQRRTDATTEIQSSWPGSRPTGSQPATGTPTGSQPATGTLTADSPAAE